MSDAPAELVSVAPWPKFSGATLVLAFSGWMDGGDVSTGTVKRLVDLLEAQPLAEIEADSFYIYNLPGSMEVAALFRPHIEIDDGLPTTIELPTNTFYCHPPNELILFVGKEPNLRWQAFSRAIFHFAHEVGVGRILFVGSFGGSVPHTREPRLYVACSDQSLLDEMEPFGVRHTGCHGPGSFTSFLMTQAPDEQLQMISLVAEIPGYLQGPNPPSIEAVTRRLSKILQLPLDIDSLRSVSTQWEMEVSSAIEDDEKMAEQVRALEEEYDNDLLEWESQNEA